MLDIAVVVTAVGEVDVTNAHRLRDALGMALQQASLWPDESVVALDMTAVGFIGSPGLTALLGAAGEAERRRTPLRIIVGENRPVIRPLQLTGLDRVLALYRSVADALA
jgi:anti-sigma B factor antagonist